MAVKNAKGERVMRLRLTVAQATQIEKALWTAWTTTSKQIGYKDMTPEELDIWYKFKNQILD